MRDSFCLRSFTIAYHLPFPLPHVRAFHPAPGGAEFHVAAAFHADTREKVVAGLAGRETALVEGLVGPIGRGDGIQFFADSGEGILLCRLAEQTFFAGFHTILNLKAGGASPPPTCIPNNFFFESSWDS